MIPIDAIAPGPLLLAVLLSPALQEQGPAPSGAGPAAEAPAGTGGDLPATLREDVELLEAMLRLRESRISEARRFFELEDDVLKTVLEQRQFGASMPREVELIEVRHAAAGALLEARQAERDEVAIRLEQLRRLAEAPSPEVDRDERRTRLDEEVRLREAQLRAREARVRATEAQIASEESSRKNFVDSVRRGIASPGAARQAMFRVAEASSWHDAMAAERDAAQVQLRRAQRRLAQFDDPAATDPDLDRPSVEDLESRLASVEHLVDVLRDEMYHMQWELQLFRNQQHERFGAADRFGTPPTVPGVR